MHYSKKSADSPQFACVRILASIWGPTLRKKEKWGVAQACIFEGLKVNIWKKIMNETVNNGEYFSILL